MTSNHPQFLPLNTWDHRVKQFPSWIELVPNCFKSTYSSNSILFSLCWSYSFSIINETSPNNSEGLIIYILKKESSVFAI